MAIFKRTSTLSTGRSCPRNEGLPEQESPQEWHQGAFENLRHPGRRAKLVKLKKTFRNLSRNGAEYHRTVTRTTERRFRKTMKYPLEYGRPHHPVRCRRTLPSQRSPRHRLPSSPSMSLHGSFHPSPQWRSAILQQFRKPVYPRF